MDHSELTSPSSLRTRGLPVVGVVVFGVGGLIACAVGLALFFVMLGLTLAQFRLFSSRVFYR